MRAFGLDKVRGLIRRHTQLASDLEALVRKDDRYTVFRWWERMAGKNAGVTPPSPSATHTNILSYNFVHTYGCGCEIEKHPP